MLKRKARPLAELFLLHRQLAERFGWELVGEAQRGFEDAHELLDRMVAKSGATVRVERFSGHIKACALFSLALVGQQSRRWRWLPSLPQCACPRHRSPP
jgi:hypothetical protein